MSTSRALVPVTTLLVLLVAATSRSPSGPDLTAPSDRWESKEIGRIRAHFDSVLSELGARGPRDLNQDQRTQRSRLMETLGAYRDRGVFPHNYDFPSPTPYFIDRETGTLCAVAFLLSSTGRDDIVQRVARADNNVWVARLADDTAFSRWLDANGVTLDEAARIQVPYMEDPRYTDGRRFELTDDVSPALKVAAPVAVAGSLVASIWNATANRNGSTRFANLLGVASGIASTGVGTALLTQRGASDGGAAAMMALGGATVALATRGIFHHRGVLRAERETARRLAAAQASVAPFVTPDGGAGVGVSIAF